MLLNMKNPEAKVPQCMKQITTKSCTEFLGGRDDLLVRVCTICKSSRMEEENRESKETPKKNRSPAGY